MVCPGHLAVVLIGADTEISCHPAALRLDAMPKGFLHNWLDTVSLLHSSFLSKEAASATTR